MKVGLIITTYNRPKLLEQCLESVLMARAYAFTSEMQIYLTTYIVDDNSTDPETLDIIETFSNSCKVIKKDKNKGIKDSLLIGFDEAFTEEEHQIGDFVKPYKSCYSDYAINLDGDAIVSKTFFTRLIDLKTRFPERIISGFNCNHPKNPVLFDGGDYVERKHANGINMCMNKQDYETIVRPALMKDGNWDFNSTNKKNFIITKPSVVDHLGWDCSTMNHVNGDRAFDF